jgi:L-asparaginase/Glu-tRNA(Gln) amidotransferase subunit D
MVYFLTDQLHVTHETSTPAPPTVISAGFLHPYKARILLTTLLGTS